MQAESYTQFSQELHRKVTSQRIPVTATIEVSHRCSLNCVHCYNNLPMNDARARRSELTPEEMGRVLDEMADAGVLWLLFSGGEIFARHDFLDIYTDAKKKGFLITLFTNGTLITERVADYLAEWRPFAIEITIYGATKETYEKLTRVPGSFDRCMKGIDLLVERNLPLTLKTVVTSINRHEVFAMQDLARERGVVFRYDAMINPRTDCSASPLAVRLSPAHVVELDFIDPRRASEWKDFAAAKVGTLHTPGEEDRIYHCGGGINSFAIDPEGKMTICVLSHFDSFDLREGTLRQGWDWSLRQIRDKRATRKTKCTDCQIKAICGMCPANGELENGDPEEPVDFLCEVAHLRAEVFDFPVAEHGECEYCEGGDSRQELEKTACDIRQRTPIELHPDETPGPSFAETGCASAGCDNCGFAVTPEEVAQTAVESV